MAQHSFPLSTPSKFIFPSHRHQSVRPEHRSYNRYRRHYLCRTRRRSPWISRSRQLLSLHRHRPWYMPSELAALVDAARICIHRRSSNESNWSTYCIPHERWNNSSRSKANTLRRTWRSTWCDQTETSRSFLFVLCRSFFRWTQIKNFHQIDSFSSKDQRIQTGVRTWSAQAKKHGEKSSVDFLWSQVIEDQISSYFQSRHIHRATISCRVFLCFRIAVQLKGFLQSAILYIFLV